MLRVRAPVSSEADSALQWYLEVPAPEPIAVGHGSAVHLAGWCFHRDASIHGLRFLAAGMTTPALAHSLPRPDVREALYPERDPRDNAYASGFYAVIPLPGVTAPEDINLVAQVDLAGGRTEEYLIDVIKVVPSLEIDPVPDTPANPVVVSMATYNPPYELFARQIESITQQSYSDWCCIISDDRSHPANFDRIRQLLRDDDRFVLDRSRLHLGAYHNFERALALAPSGAQYLALADQDDRWHPDKLEQLVGALGGDATLAYSDCRVIHPDGSVLSETFFASRRNNWSDLRKMLLGNTVTGASTIFRTELLDYALPFPPSLDPGVSFHDHWLACAALALGKIRYLDTALYDYVQHDGNALGHALGDTASHADRGPWMLRSRANYQSKLLRTVLMATALEQRFGGRLAPSAKRELRQLAELEHSNLALAQMAVHAIGSGRADSATDGGERDLLGAVTWRRTMARSARRRDHLAHPWYSAAPDITDGRVGGPGTVPGVQTLSDAMTPLALEVSELEPPRVNLLMRRIELDDALDNDVGKLALAASLAANGVETRVIAVAGADHAPDVWARLQAIPGTPAADQFPEIVGSDAPVRVSPTDVFIATDWSTAHAAHRATDELTRKGFLYVIDEYAGDRTSPALKDEMERSYTFPHSALFWSERLETYFRSQGLGNFSPERTAELPNATVAPALTQADKREFVESRAARALLVHAPLDPETGDSMLELAVLALDRVADAGLLSGWEVNAIGTHMPSPVRLTDQLEVVSLEPITRGVYGDLLANHDLALSLAPAGRFTTAALELAAAGLPTLTVALDGADAQWLEAASPNLIPVAPNPEDLARELATALERLSEPDQRVGGATFSPPNSWRESLNPAVLGQIRSQLASCGEPRITPAQGTRGRAALRRVKHTLVNRDDGTAA